MPGATFYELATARSWLDWLDKATVAHRQTGLNKIREILYTARHAMLLEADVTGASFDEGKVLDFFDEVTKKIELATQEILVTDRYMGSEFATRYLPHVKPGVTVRLLTLHRIPQLLTAVELAVSQYSINVEIREDDFHDRYLIIDRRIGFMSGSSFKDGAKKTPTALIEVSQLFSAVLQQCETAWTNARVYR